MSHEQRSGDGIIPMIDFNRGKFFKAVERFDPMIAADHGCDGIASLSEYYAPLHENDHVEKVLRSFLAGNAIKLIIQSSPKAVTNPSDVKNIIERSAFILVNKVHEAEYLAMIDNQPQDV